MSPADRPVAISRRPRWLRTGVTTKGLPGWRRACLPLGLLLGLGGCGGGQGQEGPIPTYSVGGTVIGVLGSGLVLRNNLGEGLPVATDGTFNFTKKFDGGTPYTVSVGTQPSNPNQRCDVFQAAGTVVSGNIDDVVVDCTTITSGTFIGVDYGTSGDDGSYGITPFDGAGNFTSTSIENNAGTIASGVSDVGTYVNSFDGSIMFNFNNGFVSADGNAIVSADLNSGEQAYVDIEVRQRQDPVTNAELEGRYLVVTYGNSGDSATLWTLVADGSGHFTGSEVQNNGGVITPSSAIAGTYAVAADGTVSVTPATGPPLSGGLSVDGNTLLLSQLTSAQGPSITLGVRQGQSGFSMADASGDYAVVVQENSGDSSSLWTLVFDDKGNISGSGNGNDNEKIVSSSLTGTYSIATDGSLTASFGGKAFTGGISADGKRLVLTNLNSGVTPDIWIGIRTGNYNPWDY